MRISLAFAALLFGYFGVVQAALAGGSATASQIEAEIRMVGAKAFIEKNFEHDPWLRILAGIKSANPRWVAIGELLKPESDAASSEELDDAYFSALAVNPLRMLPVMIRVYKTGPAQLCNQTFEAELPKNGVAAYLGAIERGLRNPRNKSERMMAIECKKGLAASRQYAKENGLR